jgi:hypothetical protein
MPRPFGLWAPATTVSELKARIPRPFDFSLKLHMSVKKNEYFYHPDAMAWFKDPQQFKDTVDTLRKMRYSDKFWGDGCRMPEGALWKTGLGVLGFVTPCWVFTTWFYESYMPANNPTWRKIKNKEWEEAINNSPWDHMSHAWGYSDAQGVNFGAASTRGKKRFIIPA